MHISLIDGSLYKMSLLSPQILTNSVNNVFLTKFTVSIFSFVINKLYHLLDNTNTQN